jgi:hypothetical protein
LPCGNLKSKKYNHKQDAGKSNHSASAIFDLRQQNKTIKIENDDEPNPAAKPQSKVSRTTLMPEGDALPGERRGLTEGSAIFGGARSDRKLGENSEDDDGGQKASGRT